MVYWVIILKASFESGNDDQEWYQSIFDKNEVQQEFVEHEKLEILTFNCCKI